MGVLFSIGYPILFLVVYGLMSMLVAVIYNKLASRFGGFTLRVPQ